MSLLRNYENTVSALCYSLCYLHTNPENPQLSSPYNDVVCFVHHQVGNIASYLRLPLTAMTLFFSIGAVLFNGNFFYRQTPEKRLAYLTKWKQSKLSPLRDFIRFYESLVLISMYSRLDSRSALYPENNEKK